MVRSLHTKFAKSLVCASIFVTLQLLAGTAFGQFVQGHLVIAQDATTTSSAAEPVMLEYTTLGALVHSYSLTPTGTYTITQSGSAGSEGHISLSAERDRIIVAGYAAGIGTATVASTTSASVPRVVAAVSPAGTYSVYASSNSLFSANNIRSATSLGNNYYASGSNTGVTLMTGVNTSTVISTSQTNTRDVAIYNGNLFVVSNSGSFKGVNQVGSGIPTTSGQTEVVDANQTSSNGPYGFAFSPDMTTLYVADASTGILKFAQISAGVYSVVSTGYTTAGLVYGTSCHSIAVDFSTTGGPTIYALPNSSQTSGNPGTTLIKFQDAGTTVTTATTLTTTTSTFRGLCWAPAVSASITTTDASVCSGNTTTLSITGNPYAVVTYSVNGVASTATITPTGTYTVTTAALTSSTTYALGSCVVPSGTYTLSGSVTVSINSLPSPTLSVSPTAINTGATAVLTFGGATGDVIAYTDGVSTYSVTVAAGPTQTVNVSPSVAGSYTYTVTSARSAAGCQVSSITGVTAVLTVTDAPFANIGAGSTTICSGGSGTYLVFTGNAGATVTYGDGTTSGLTTLLSGTIGGGTGTSSVTITPTASVTTYTLTSVTSGSTVTPVTGSVSVTVNPAPGNISGSTLSVCVNNNITLTDGSTGAWSSLSGNATIVGSTGVVTGQVAGTATIVFTSTVNCTTTAVVTVNALPTVNNITGTGSVCPTATTQLSDATGSGVWSVIGSNASVNSTGLVTGNTAGTALISYTITSGLGCVNAATQVVTVNPAANAGTITGSSTIYGTGSTTLADLNSGGVWSSSNTGIVTVVGSTGVVTGVTAGSATITYTVIGCGTAYTTFNMTVAPGAVPFTVGNIAVLQQGDGVEALSADGNSVYIKEYSSTGALVQTIPVDNSGSHALIESGSASSEGFMTRADNGKYLVIPGYNVNIGGTTGLTTAGIPRAVGNVDGTGAYNYIHSNTAFYSGNNYRSATGDGAGHYWTGGTPNGLNLFVEGGSDVTGVCTTTSNTRVVGDYFGQLYYSTGSGTIGIYSVSPSLPAATGATGTNIIVDPGGSPYGFVFNSTHDICYLADDASTTANGGLEKWTRSGGTWSLAYTYTALDGTTGCHGVAVDWSGSSPVIYVTTAEASANKIVKVVDNGSVVSSTVSTIATAATLTKFGSVELTPFTATISSAAPSVCNGNGTTVTIKGSANATVTYQIAGVTQTPVVMPSTGIYTISTGALTSNTAYSLVSITGDLATSQTLTGSVTVSVNPLPVISSVSSTPNPVCSGSSLTLSSSVSGAATYSWNGPNGYTASVQNPTAFTASALSAGIYTLAATSALGCSVTATSLAVSVNPLPAPTIVAVPTSIVTGSGASSALTFTGVPGDVVYYWDGTTTQNVTITGSGTASVSVTPTVTTTYSVTSATSAASCSVTVTGQNTTINVGNPTATISGSTTICNASSTNILFSGTPGATVTYTPDGGTTNPTVLLDGTTGTYTLSVSPSANTTYSLVSINYTSFSGPLTGSAFVSVNPLPGTILGTLNVCVNSSTTLSDAGGGTWSSSNTNATVVGSSGVVTGATAGTATITYQIATGCIMTSIVTVNPLPATGVINGSVNVCPSATVSLSDATGSGVWSVVGANASVDGSGNVMGLLAGTATVSYTITDGNGCVNAATRVETVNPSPYAGAITGTASVIVNGTTTLTDGISGGVWSSTNNLVGTVGTSGIVSGLATGSTTISYTVTNSCGSAAATVNVTSATGGLVYYDDFDGTGYTNGSSIIAPGLWVSGSGSGAATFIDQTSSPITSPGVEYYNGGGANNIVINPNGTTSTNQKTISHPFNTGGSNNTYYYSFLLNVSNVATGGNYNIGLTPTGFTSYFARVWINPSGAGYNLGASKSSVVTYGTSVLAPNTTYVVVVRYTFNPSTGTDDQVYLWVNPDLSAEPSTSGAEVSITSGADATEPTAGGSIILRSNYQDPVFNFDAVRVALAPTSSAAWTYLNPFAPPAPTFTVSPANASACTGTNTSYTASATVAQSYKWQRSTTGTGGTYADITSSSMDAGVTYAGMTTGTLTLTSATSSVNGYAYRAVATNVTGSVNSTGATLTINQPPTGLSASASPNPVCSGSNLTLTGSATGAATYAWSGPGLYTATDENPAAFAVTTGGTYTFTATTSNSCSATYTTNVVTINPLPTPVISASPLDIVSGNSSTITFAGNTGDVVTYSWAGGSPATATVGGSGTVTVSVSPTVTTTYSITAATSLLGCNTPITTQTVTVTVGNPTATISGATTICSGSSTNIVFTGTPGATVTYTADGGDTNPTVLLDGTGNYSLSVTPSVGNTTYTLLSIAYSAFTGPLSGSAIVTVNALPASPGVITGTPLAICAGNTTNLTDANAGGVWSSGSAHATVGTNGQVSGVSGGTATISYTMLSVGCGSLSATQVVTINPLPAPTIAGSTSITTGNSTNIVFSGVSGDVVSYSWNGGSSATTTISGTGSTSVSVTPSVTTTYSVTSATSALGCPATITGQTATVTVTGGGLVYYQDFSTGFTAGSSVVAPTGTFGIISGTTTPTASFVAQNSSPITSPSVEYYNGGGGMYVLATPATNQATRGDIFNIAASTTSHIYYSLLVNISSGDNPITSSNFNVALDAGAITATNYTGRLYFAAPATGSGYKIGLSKGANTPVYNATAPTTLNYNTTHVIVVRYDFNSASGTDDNMYMWIDPDLSSEPSTATAEAMQAGTGTDGTLPTSTASFAFRDNAPADVTAQYDGMRVAYGPTSAIAWKYLNPYAPPAPSFTVNPTDASVCTGSSTSITASANATNATTGYKWQRSTTGTGGTFADITSTSMDAGVTYGGLTTGTLTLTTPTTAVSGYAYRVVAANITGTVTSTAATLTVHTAPTATSANVNGPICAGTDLNLSVTGAANVTGYLWNGPVAITSSTSASASVPAAGTSATGIYTLTVNNGTGTGCSATYTTSATVSAFPTLASANNDGPICAGTTLNLSVTAPSNVTGYLWRGPVAITSSTSASASIPSTTTAANGIYTLTINNGTGTGCTATYTTSATVSAFPAVTSANNSGPICAGTDLNLSVTGAAHVTGYLWNGPVAITSSTSASASVPAAGTSATGIYTLTVNNGTGTGCSATYTTSATVSAFPTLASANNDGPICAGTTLNLSVTAPSNVTGYLWRGPVAITSSTSASASIPSTTTAANGIYTVTVNNGTGTGCTATYTTSATVSPFPSVTSANNSGPICSGTDLNLSVTGASNVTGYLWNGPVAITSSTSASASVPAAGTSATGIYTLTINNGTGTGCTATYTTSATVSPFPSIGGVTNDAPICTGATLHLNVTAPITNVTGYSWSGPVAITSSTSASATVPSVSLLADGIYTLAVNNGTGTGCVATYTTFATVNTAPTLSLVTNNGPLCAGTDLNLGVTGALNVTDYLWAGPVAITNATLPSASVPSAGVSASGVYTLTIHNGTGAGCSFSTTTTAVVSPFPTITGASNDGPICAGNTLHLSTSGASNVTGYLWHGPVAITSSTSANATVPSATSAATGVYTVTINNGTGLGCTSDYTTAATVNPLPTAIHGSVPVCVGNVISLSDDVPGGAWSSSNTNASVDGSGNVTGVTAGTVLITYTVLPANCPITVVVTVNPLPLIVLGSNNVCVGSSVTLSDVTTGGTWMSTNSTNASVGSTSSIVNGLIAGTTTIVYTLPTGCLRTFNMTVNPITAILGSPVVCAGGATTSLSDLTEGGTWSSSNGTVATIGTDGKVTGVATTGGTPTMTYLIAATGCKATVVVTVNPIAQISGNAPVCMSSVLNLSDATAGGAWTSSAPLTGSVDGSGHVSGLQNGTTTISYTITGTGCAAGVVVTVNPVTPVQGTAAVCTGATTSLSDATAGGTWSSSNGSVATIGTDGTVNAVSMTGGTATMTYLIGSTGCKATAVVTVNPITPVLGTGVVCSGATIHLSDATGGGVWSATGTATVSATGVVMGVTAGTSIISYSITATNCASGAVVTVNQSPSIFGAFSICAGSGTTLTDNMSGGTWSSSAATKATIDGSAGTVAGLVAGTTNISYVVSNGCSAGQVLTVNGLPGAISGSTSAICVDATVHLSDATAGGNWTVDVNATVDGSGNVMGSSPGIATVSYTLGSGCMATKIITVSATPAPFGGVALCAGSTVTLNTTPAGGTWSSSNTIVATIGSSSGVLTGVASGDPGITYTVASGCFTIAVVTVNAILPINGNVDLCPGGSATLTDGTPGGTWSSSGAAITIVGSTGLISAQSVGTATAIYTTPGCVRSTLITVNPSAGTITGNTSLCVSSTTMLSDAGIAGTWSSSSGLVATVGSTGLVVAGVYTGTTTISYTAGPGGCVATTIVTVNGIPGFISGPYTECMGNTVALIETTPGGSWSASNENVSVDGSGNVRGVTAGSSTISYTVNGCSVTYPMQVNTSPTPIFGNAFALCVGAVTYVYDTTATSESYTSSMPSVATVLNSGAITGISAGTTTITYTINTGCIATQVVTVNGTIPGISGNNTSVCPGFQLSLSDTYGPGNWTSSNTSIANGGTSGNITGVSGGTATITYMPSGTAGCMATTVVTVNAAPPVTGTLTMCSGSGVTLHNTVSGGTWSSPDGVGIVSVGSATGVVTGIVGGTATISYNTGSCGVAVVVTVNQTATISNNTPICTGTPIALSPSVSGGAWSSSNSHASIDGSGNVTGVSAGTSTISYVTTAGCLTTTITTVNITPAAISGAGAVCAGLSITLSDGTTGGAWSSPDGAGIVSVGGTGVVSGIAPGNATIQYATSTCTVTAIVTVNTQPGIMAALYKVCAGSTISLSDSPAGGTWSSTNGNATVDGSGNVTGTIDAAGTTGITYTLANGCSATTTVSVSILPSAIMGATSVCPGTTITLSDIPTGGTWSTTASTISVGSASGVVTGITPGTATVVYQVGSGCTVSAVVAVTTPPPSVLGTLFICAGSTTSLSDVSGGGTWNSSNALIASVNSSTGIVSAGTTLGTANITYTATTGCITSSMVTVVANPAVINGLYTECVGAVVTLSDATIGGTWSTVGTNISVDGSGNVTGLVAGSGTVTYTAPVTGCKVTYPMTVNRNPTAIYGTFAVCPGTTVYVYDTTATSMSYTSSTPSVATVLNSGAITGITPGTSTITYTISTGCKTTQVITVNALPVITGNAPVCAAATMQLTDGSAGGAWSTSNSAIATVSSTGVVTGVSGGTATITRVATTGCSATTIVTVNPILPINGPLSVCSGTTVTLSDATTGGNWTSSNGAVATVGLTTGIVTGAGSGGIVQITYTATNLCSRTVTMTVSPAATPITAVTSSIVCQGYTTALTDAAAGGTWSSSSTLVATVSSAGVVTGTTTHTGPVAIYYTVSGCVATYVVTVTTNPANITGATAECVGTTVSLTDVTAGGTWISNNANVTVDGSGHVLGNTAGTSVVTYTQNGCFVTYPMSVRANPVPMTGTFNVCMGTTAYVYDASTVSQSYKSGNTAVATITNAGAITPITTGTSTITYTINTGCYITQDITVNALPVVAAISGPPSISHGGAPAILSDATPGGVWTSSSPTVIALSGAGAGSVTATAIVTAGSANISYTVTNAAGCVGRAVKNIGVSARFAGTNTGSTANVFAGSTVSIADDVYTGAWTSGDNGIATVDGNGIVTGIKPGTVNITHAATNGNGEVRTTITPVIVSALPASLTILPNPNKGTFVVKGTLGSVSDEEVTLEVTDVLGQVIYKTKVTAQSGRLNEAITLNNTLANGMYMLNVHSATEKMTFHFVVEQ